MPVSRRLKKGLEVDGNANMRRSRGHDWGPRSSGFLCVDSGCQSSWRNEGSYCRSRSDVLAQGYSISCKLSLDRIYVSLQAVGGCATVTAHRRTQLGSDKSACLLSMSGLSGGNQSCL